MTSKRRQSNPSTSGARPRRARAAFASALLAGVAVLAMPAPPAGALTNNEKFTTAVYDDFLLREPTASELTWWSAYLQSGTRGSMLTSILNDTEFENLWVLGASLYYLGTTDSTFGTVVSNLNTSGNFVASEVALIAGTTYFDDNGGTNESFVEAVYLHTLLRPALSSDVTYWAGRLNAATATRPFVAASILRSSESATARVAGTPGQNPCLATSLESQGSLAAGSYCIVLDRLADSGGLTYWSQQLTGSGQLPTLWISLASSAEYYTNAQTRF
ncbi:MAG TPA: DUF4214 domain-containing protein [Iamia sp.]|jgi:hypothetical protein|nr:DUF4214 domain-containing protein [Iamia sp.]